MKDSRPDEQLNQDALSTPACPRAEDLLMFLYKEATEDEAHSFTGHLSACASCRDELDAFGGVRASVGMWREEALSAASSFGLEPSLARARGDALPPVRKRSALAAFREFFALSPRWLQFGGATAALMVCALAALTVARAGVRWDDKGFALQTGASERVLEKRVEVPVASGASREELNALAAERDRFKSELEALRNQQSGAATLNASALPDSSSDNSSSKLRRAEGSHVEVDLKETARNRRAPRGGLSRVGEVASKGRLDDRDEDNLPRLFDLLNEVN